MRIRKSVQALLQFKMLKEKWKRAWAWISQVEDYTPDILVKSQWQFGETSTVYLVYRWMVASFFVCGLLASMMDLGRERRPPSHYLKWPIYFTSWGFTMCTVQAIISTVYVTRNWARVRSLYPNAVEIEKMRTSYKIYWILHSVATIVAITVTSIYWTTVYNPKTDNIDGVNVTVHILNSVVMVLDLWIVAHPFKLLHYYWTLVIGSLYITFTYIYFLFGGTDRKGEVFIYKIVDWRRPLNAVIAGTGVFVLAAIITVLLWIMSILKRRLANLFHQKMGARPSANTDQRPQIV